MNFLAVDTSAKQLTVLVYRGGRVVTRGRADCAMRHSVLLMDEIDGALREAELTPRECDFFAAVTGPGSFTGIRIGISTVKGLCVALQKPALSVTSFDCIAYAEKGDCLLALVNAGHSHYYARRYRGGEPEFGGGEFLTDEQAEDLIRSGYRPCAGEELPITCNRVDAANGLLNACLALSGKAAPPEQMQALYIRKSSAEENAK